MWSKCHCPKLYQFIPFVNCLSKCALNSSNVQPNISNVFEFLVNPFLLNDCLILVLILLVNLNKESFLDLIVLQLLR